MGFRSLRVLAFTSLLAAAHAVAAPVDGPAVHVGDNAPLFMLPAINTEPALRMTTRASVALSDLTGVNPAYPAELVLVHFCDKAGGAVDLPVLDKVAKKYASRGVKVLAVVSDGSDIPVLSAWVEGLKLSYPALQDRYGVVSGRYGVKKFPLTVLIDAQGDIDALGVPGANMEGELEALVAARLK